MKIPIYLQILLGMFFGIVIGVIALNINGQQFVNDWIKPWGQIFIRLLQLVAVPLVFVSLVKGVASLTDTSRLSRIGLRTICIYLFTTVVAISVGLSLALLVKPGSLLDLGQAVSIHENYRQTVDAVVEVQQERNGPLNFLYDIIPSNFISAAGNNRQMLQIIFFALLFGIAALSIGREKIKPVLKLFD